MKLHSGNNKSESKRSVASSVTAVSGNASCSNAFVDRRPTAIAQGKLQAAIIQTKISSPFQKVQPSPAIIRIQKNIDLYNSIGGFRITFPYEERRQALDQLVVVEHLVYHWFTVNPSHDLQTDPTALKMKELLNEIQKERRDLVVRSIANKDEDPPVANFKLLPKELGIQVKFLWESLLKNDKIVIASEKGFMNQILADFSRLLETRMGQRLISGILFSNKGLTIIPTTLAKGKFVASPTEPENEGFKQVDPEVHDTSGFVEVDMTKSSHANILDLLQDLRVKHPESTGMRVISDKGVLYFSFGSGSASNLPVPEDATDAKEHNSSRMADKDGNEVITPTFIILGHELGHVLRSAQGMSAAYEGDALVKHGFPEGQEYNRPEEFFNIEGVENALREQSGIAHRHSHGNLYSHWALELIKKTDILGKSIEKLKELLKSRPEAVKLLESAEEHRFTLIGLIQALLNGKGSIQNLMNEVDALVMHCDKVKQKYAPVEMQPEEPESISSLILGKIDVPVKQELPKDNESESIGVPSKHEIIEPEKPVKKEVVKEEEAPKSGQKLQSVIIISSWAEVRDYIIEEDVHTVYEGKKGTKVRGRNGGIYAIEDATGGGQFRLKLIG